MRYTTLTAEQVADAGLADWRFALGVIHAHFTFGDFPTATQFAARVAEAAEAAVHHPDLDVRYPGRVHIALTTHETGGITTADTELAATISSIASELGASSDPLRTQALELALDVMSADAVRPFWAAVLDYQRAADGSLYDPRRVGPAMWFQQMDEPRSQRNRFHLDISVPDDVAEQRLAAALAAGGVLLTDEYAKAFWVLADAEGNEACICTWQDRA
jgi:4a-hydroxytetrahydrobiopterin dehydratase